MKKIIVLIVAFVVCITNVNAAKNPYKQSGPYGTNCTWYVWQQVNNKANIALPGWGNAKNWYNDAQKSGYSVGQTPKAKSIVVWDNWTEYGHVGYVESVDENYIYVWDSTGGDTEYIEPEFSECIAASPSVETDALCYKNYTKTVAAKYSYKNSEYKITGYIYLDKVPTKPTVSNSEDSSSENTEIPKTETKKSSNANLSSLKIDGLDFEFKKDTLKYELVAENNIESIKINAKTENNKAKVSGSGEHKLNVGLNTIDVVVNAEDNTQKTYTLEVKRKDNNANLSSLVISDIDFEFKQDILEYEFDVSNDVSKINIIGNLESETATLEGAGEYSLNEGENIITLTVTAEDNTEKIYKLNIKREAKEEIIEDKKEEKTLNKQKLYLIIGISSALLVIIIVVIVVIVIKRKKKNSKNKDRKDRKKKNSKKTKK